MTKTGPTHKRISMDPEEAKKLLETGDYSMPETYRPVDVIEQRIANLEQQVRQLQEQQKNLLEYIRELSLIISEDRVDDSAK